MGKATLSRKDKEKLRHKKEILSSALKLFSEKGFYNVSMRDIAQKSEFSIGTLYNFFESKESLFSELIDNTAQQISNEFTEILNGEGTEYERLSSFFRSLVKFCRQHKEIIKLYVSVLSIQGSMLSKTGPHDNVRENIRSMIEQIIKEGIDKGQFRPVDPEITSIAINSANEAIIFDIAESTEESVLKEKFRRVEQLFLEGLLKPV